MNHPEHILRTLDSHLLEPDLSFVTDTLDSVTPHLRPGQILSLESTTYPGTTEEEVVSRVEAAGFTVGTDRADPPQSAHISPAARANEP